MTSSVVVGSASPKKGARNSFRVRPGERLEQALGRVQLEQGLGLAGGREIGMRIGVASNLMALADHALEQAALGQRILADDEEGRRHLLRP